MPPQKKKNRNSMKAPVKSRDKKRVDRQPGRKVFNHFNSSAAPPGQKKDFHVWRLHPLFFTVLMLLLWMITAAALFYRQPRLTVHHVAGETADQTVYAEVDFEYTDLEQTEKQRDLALEEEPLVFRVDTELKQERISHLEELISFYKSLSLEEQDDVSPPSSPPLAREIVQKINRQEVSPETVQRLMNRQEWTDGLKQILTTVLRQGIRPEQEEELFEQRPGSREQVRIIDPERESRSLVQRIEEIPTPEEAVEAVLQKVRTELPTRRPGEEEKIAEILSETIITANLSFDQLQTSAYRQSAAAQIEDITRTVSAGDVLLREGEIITDAVHDKLRTHNLQMRLQDQEHELFPPERLATIALIFILVLGFGCGLFLFDQPSMQERGRVLLVFTLVIIQLLLSRSTIHLFAVQEISSFFLLAAVPYAMAAVLAAQLLNLRLAIWISVFTSLIVALLANGSMEIFIAGLITSFVGALLIHRARRRIHMFQAGIWLGMAVFFSAALFLIDRGAPTEAFARLALIGLANGLATAILASAVMPVFEYIFGVVTDISLLEMSDLNHPLLRRLQFEAPGTFHHSLMVAILAEQAASSINANPLLARVGAYFHDIGKIPQAEYFTENTIDSGERDAHSNLQPRMSSLIILNHVKEGLALAADYKLNKTLRESIAQHHGTSLISHFFYRASQQNQQSGRNGRNKTPGQHEYRYPGPLPQRKETVLIGLADSCEAAARSLEKPTPQKIETLVGEIISSRLQDGQLDQANLTFQELALVRQALSRTLSTMYHSRAPYDKGNKNDDQNQNQQSNQKTDNPRPEKDRRNG